MLLTRVQPRLFRDILIFQIKQLGLQGAGPQPSHPHAERLPGEGGLPAQRPQRVSGSRGATPSAAPPCPWRRLCTVRTSETAGKAPQEDQLHAPPWKGLGKTAWVSGGACVLGVPELSWEVPALASGPLQPALATSALADGLLGFKAKLGV